jgi:membrane protease subunit (stomatin/prohibitin family)
VRVYLPATAAQLRELIGSGELPTARTAFAVTPGLREWYVDDDIEELEYAAMLEAARASLRLLDADPSTGRRRVVVAADVPDAAVQVRDELDRGVVHLGVAVRLSAVASVHVDDAEAAEAVAAAAAAITAADLGDDAAQNCVEDAEGFELSWYVSQEIPALLDSL